VKVRVRVRVKVKGRVKVEGKVERGRYLEKSGVEG